MAKPEFTPAFSWDEYVKKPNDSRLGYAPNEAHTARGWASVANHPELSGLHGRYFETSGYATCGNYCEYGGHQPKGPIHAVAYYQSLGLAGVSSVSLGAAYFQDVESARTWIMAQVANYCGAPMLSYA